MDAPGMDKQAQAALKRAIGMLEAILTRQIAIHREMLVVAAGKQEAVLKGDIEGLERTVSEEKKLVARIEEEESARAAVMPMVRAGLELDASVEKLEPIIEAMPEPERERLMGVRETLKGLLEECQLKNRHNAELLKASLEHVEAFLRSISDAASKDSAYGRDGKRAGGGPSFIDRSA